MNRTTWTWLIVLAVLVLACVFAFGLLPRSAADTAARTADPRYVLSADPGGAQDVIAVRTNAKDQEDVVVIGRIGGRENPWINDAAAFSIVDRSLKPCNAIPGDTCKTPWDYCCEADLPKATLLVSVHDSEDKIVKTDARDVLGVKELDTVVIQGKARRDADGNVSIVASKVFVAPDQKVQAP